MKIVTIIFSALFITLPVFGQQAKKIKITDLEKIIAESKTPLVINFWATYCKPCIEEMPYFLALEKEYKKDNLQLLLVSLDMEDDYPSKVDAFLQKRKITSVSAWLDETNADYFCPKIDASWSGALPATLFVNNNDRYKKFVEDSFSKEKLKKEIEAMLKR
ncbi:TlpA disulfide reductase family protein [Terrimonas pollutisoli]|uniref:TlpA disulfide reductase family protein n=1 Tax=Terrimonas pollutisoli TaxID=3034147 RepID=UPI0023EB204E|nr:TlpA disulfide reductase family protein [Terrimonas sp. H1YJ31]